MKDLIPLHGLIIESIDPLHPDATFILHEAAREMREIYAEFINATSPLPVNQPAIPRSPYLIARLEGKPVGSIAIRPLDADTAEICRLYVLLEFRQHGIARTLLNKIEKVAVDLGYSALRLETGNRQHGAIKLYQSYGYKPISTFGEYKFDPTSVCFEKILRGLGYLIIEGASWLCTQE